MAKIWDIAGKHLADFVGHTKGVHSAVFSPDGSQILTLSREDNTAKLWNTEGEMLADFVGHTDMINSAVFSPDGSWIITASDDQIAKIWPGPQRIYDYLKKESTITQLTIEQRRAYRID
jgi:WD40 repeat protein